jgi:hypothetical protein
LIDNDTTAVSWRHGRQTFVAHRPQRNLAKRSESSWLGYQPNASEMTKRNRKNEKDQQLIPNLVLSFVLGWEKMSEFSTIPE